MKNSQETVSELFKKAIELSKEDLLTHILFNYNLSKSNNVDSATVVSTTHIKYPSKAVMPVKKYVTSPEQAQEIYKKIVKENSPEDINALKNKRNFIKEQIEHNILKNNCDENSNNLMFDSTQSLDEVKGIIDNIKTRAIRDFSKDLALTDEELSAASEAFKTANIESSNTSNKIAEEISDVLAQLPEVPEKRLSLQEQLSKLGVEYEIISLLQNALSPHDKSVLKHKEDLRALKSMQDKIDYAKTTIDNGNASFRRSPKQLDLNIFFEKKEE